VDDAANSVFAWARHAPGANPVVVVVNLTPVAREGYTLGLPRAGNWAEVLNTDAERYGGGNRGNLGGVEALEGEWSGRPAHAAMTLPPLGAIYLEHRGSVTP
jgi:1,4-alpha-glucan branching enzyme